MAIYEMKRVRRDGEVVQELYRNGEHITDVPYPEREPNERFVHRIRCRSYGGENGTCMRKSRGNGTSHLSMSCDGLCDRMRKYDRDHNLTDKYFLTQVL